jgi:hypothetical protein
MDIATDYGINIVSIEDIYAGDELFDDYRRHGVAPRWLRNFSIKHKIHLNFADCNDFVAMMQVWE